MLVTLGTSRVKLPKPSILVPRRRIIIILSFCTFKSLYKCKFFGLKFSLFLKHKDIAYYVHKENSILFILFLEKVLISLVPSEVFLLFMKNLSPKEKLSKLFQMKVKFNYPVILMNIIFYSHTQICHIYVKGNGVLLTHSLLEISF